MSKTPSKTQVFTISLLAVPGCWHHAHIRSKVACRNFMCQIPTTNYLEEEKMFLVALPYEGRKFSQIPSQQALSFLSGQN